MNIITRTLSNLSYLIKYPRFKLTQFDWIREYSRKNRETKNGINQILVQISVWQFAAISIDFPCDFIAHSAPYRLKQEYIDFYRNSVVVAMKYSPPPGTPFSRMNGETSKLIFFARLARINPESDISRAIFSQPAITNTDPIRAWHVCEVHTDTSNVHRVLSPRRDPLPDRTCEFGSYIHDGMFRQRRSRTTYDFLFATSKRAQILPRFVIFLEKLDARCACRQDRWNRWSRSKLEILLMIQN